jgi:hypothetical protein
VAQDFDLVSIQPDKSLDGRAPGNGEPLTRIAGPHETPFGVEIDRYRPLGRERSGQRKNLLRDPVNGGADVDVMLVAIFAEHAVGVHAVVVANLRHRGEPIGDVVDRQGPGGVGQPEADSAQPQAAPETAEFGVPGSGYRVVTEGARGRDEVDVVPGREQVVQHAPEEDDLVVWMSNHEKRSHW